MNRLDKPHTFLMHEWSHCPKCSGDVEARVVMRGGEIVHLMFCAKCGSSEATVSKDSASWMQSISEKVAMAKHPKGGFIFKQTTSSCPECLKLLKTDVVVKDGKVFFEKNCKTCGPSRALISDDAAYYIDAYTYARAGTEPLHFMRDVKHGCPVDCGTCKDHEQHTCMPIIEITDHCNLECPICIVNNQNASHISTQDFTSIIDNLVRAEGQLELVALSGGEPTTHPKLLELIDIANRDEIGRVAILSNGIRFGKDPKLAEEVKKRGAYIGFQFDGFEASVHERIRGRDLRKEKEATLAIFKEFDIPVQMIFVATKGVNDDQIGRVVDLFLKYDNIVSLNIQPAAYTGSGGGKFEHDAVDRMTIPGVIRAIEEQTDGLLRGSDFAPLPCSHPNCVSLSYLLKMNDGSFIPFGRFINFKEHGSILRSSATLGATPQTQEAMQDIIHDVFARQDDIDRGSDVLAALRRSVDIMFPGRALTQKEAVKIGERQAKSIFIHHYMDPYDFDLERLRKCCHHYPQIDGRLMPACGFNLFHRGAAKGPKTPVASWAK